MDILFRSYWLPDVSNNETSSSVTKGATERELGRIEDCWKQAMLSKAKLFYINCGNTYPCGAWWCTGYYDPFTDHLQKLLEIELCLAAGTLLLFNIGLFLQLRSSYILRPSQIGYIDLFHAMLLQWLKPTIKLTKNPIFSTGLYLYF
jgi:hypothetical protein